MFDSGNLLLQTIGLAALLGAGTVVILLLRTWSLRGARSGDASSSFTLQDLREMREREQITEEEYRTMRSAIIGPHVDDASHRVPVGRAGSALTTGSEADAPDERPTEPPDADRDGQ